MKKQGMLSALLRRAILLVLTVGLLIGGFTLRVHSASAASVVTLQVSGLNATISNGIYTIKFNTKGTGYSLVYNGTELIGAAPGFYSSINGGTGMSPTSLQVVTNTASMADIAYISSWGALHYVVRSGVSGLYSYFVASGIGTVGEFRTLYRPSGDIFRNGYNGVRTIAFPTASQINSATVVQDATYRLADGSIYTKYDMSNYTFEQDTLHGIYGNGYGMWMISPSHEYNNGGPMKQDLTVHVGTTDDTVLLNMLVSGHFGTPQVAIPAGKIYGPWLVYFNNGSLSDAQARATTETAAWPYTWLSNPSYPLARTNVSGTLHLADGRVAAGAVVTLAGPGGDIYQQGSDYIFTTHADSNGGFTLSKVRPGNYSLYAWANGGSIGDVTDQYERDNITVSGSSQSLGTLTWTPTLYSNLLWQIGTADRKAADFHLGNVQRQYGLWNQVPPNLTYTIGQSTPANDWYYAQTGVGTWTVNFNLSNTYSGNAHLTVALAGETRTATTQVAVNGTTITTWPAFTNDEAIYRSANQSGSYHLIPLTFAASLLKVGNNTITFHASSVSAGGGSMFDTIKLETGTLVTGSGGSGGTPTPTPTTQPTVGVTPTATPGSTTTPVSGASCQVNYAVTNQWAGGFGASVMITNIGTTTINGWTLTWTFANGQTITQIWNASDTQSGNTVSASSLSYNGPIAPGGNATFGFNGTWNGTNAKPTGFTLNGGRCSVS
ncbi:MAG TPA: polysaccharide lyase family protein [Ktedonobacteraceae bacterium]